MISLLGPSKPRTVKTLQIPLVLREERASLDSVPLALPNLSSVCANRTVTKLHAIDISLTSTPHLNPNQPSHGSIRGFWRSFVCSVLDCDRLVPWDGTCRYPCLAAIDFCGRLIGFASAGSAGFAGFAGFAGV
jgi:hypothetical protein